MKAAMKRIKAIPPLRHSEYVSDKAGDLATEYLRRVAVMAQSLPSWSGGPFFNPTTVTSSELGSDIESEIRAVVSEDIEPNGYVRRLYLDYIKWQAYVEMGDPVACSHPDVYEPLIRLFEQGHPLGFHHGDLMVGAFAIPLTNWLRFAEKTSLDLKAFE
jgi:hypothetical protein